MVASPREDSHSIGGAREDVKAIGRESHASDSINEVMLSSETEHELLLVFTRFNSHKLHLDADMLPMATARATGKLPLSKKSFMKAYHLLKHCPLGPVRLLHEMQHEDGPTHILCIIDSLAFIANSATS